MGNAGHEETGYTRKEHSVNCKLVIAKTKDLWHLLPSRLQATIVVGASVAGTFLGQKASQYLFDPGAACWTWGCTRHTLIAAGAAGFVAARAFYMRPGPGPKGAFGVVTTDPGK